MKCPSCGRPMRHIFAIGIDYCDYCDSKKRLDPNYTNPQYLEALRQERELYCPHGHYMGDEDFNCEECDIDHGYKKKEKR